MGKRSRDKGGKGEREAAEALRLLFPDAHRRIGQTRAQHKGADVEGCGPFYVEVELSAAPSPHRKMRQAMSEAHAVVTLVSEAEKTITIGGPPLLVLTRESSSKRSGPWLATQLLSDWLSDQAELQRLRAHARTVEGILANVGRKQVGG